MNEEDTTIELLLRRIAEALEDLVKRPTGTTYVLPSYPASPSQPQYPYPNYPNPYVWC